VGSGRAGFGEGGGRAGGRRAAGHFIHVALDHSRTKCRRHPRDRRVVRDAPAEILDLWTKASAR